MLFNRAYIFMAFCFVTLNIALSFQNPATSKRSPLEVPNPNLHPKECGRPGVTKSSICDPDNMLTKESKDVIEGLVNAVSKAQIAAVIVSAMSPKFIGVDSIESATERFAIQLHNSWGIGDANTQDGVLIFLSIGDRSMYISTGDGVKKVLYNHLDGIIENVKPALRRRDYGGALEQCVTEIDLILSGRKSEIAKMYGSSEEGDSGYLFWIIFVCVLGGAGVISYFEDKKKRSLERGRDALEKLMKEVSAAEKNEYFESSSCPICMDDFSPEFPPKKTSNTDKNEAKAESSEILESSPLISSDGEEGQVRSPDSFEIDSSRVSSSENATDLPDTSQPKRAMALRCGHIFCFECLGQYLKSADGSKCPICRQPVDPSSPTVRPNSNQQRPYPQSCASSFSSPNGWRLRVPEYRYRINRMHHLYPNVVNSESMFAMNSALECGSLAEFRRLATQRSTEAQRILTDMARKAAAKSGSKGSKSSFGGGSSGGGRGGRW